MSDFSRESKDRLGVFIKDCRLKAGKTQRELAEELGLLEGRLQVIEAGSYSDPNTRTLIALINSGILVMGDGRTVDMNLAIEILEGRLDPATGKPLGVSNGV